MFGCEALEVNRRKVYLEVVEVSMRLKVGIRPIAGLFLLFCLNALGADFGATVIIGGTNIHVEYETRTDAYYRVYSAPSITSEVWTARDIALGAGGTQAWTDVGVLSSSRLGVYTQAQFYKVSRIWLTNSLDFDGDGLADAYELTTPGVDVLDQDSDGDRVSDGDEVNVYGTAPWSPYSGTTVLYPFKTNLEGWTSDDWGDGYAALAWTNATGKPRSGCMYVEPPYTGSEGYGEFYLKDYDLHDNKDCIARPVYRIYVYVPSGAPLEPGRAVHCQLFARSSSDGWSYNHYSSLFTPTPGQWNLLSWDMSMSVSNQILLDIDEWGIKVQWNSRTNFHGGIYIDTLHTVPHLPPTNNLAPSVTSLIAVTNIVGKYEKYEVTVGLTNVYGLNPYDPGDVNLEAVFTSPGSSNWVVYGFYMEEEGDEYGDGSWKVRFAPNELGSWNVQVRVGNRYGTNSWPITNFTCVASERHGWVRVSDNDSHYLEHDDDTPFYGIGYCRCWDCDDEGIFMEAAEHGINMIHWWLAPWDTMLTVDRAYPWETWREASTFYTYEQSRARELDRIVHYAEKYGVKFVFTIWPHDAIRDFNYHKWRINGSWQRAFDTKFSEPEWYINPFSQLDDPPRNQKFFYDDKYKRYQNQLYRYIIARWGYSESIGCWALASEMFGTFANSLNCINYQDPYWVTNKVALFGENPLDNMDESQSDGKDYTISWLSYINDYFKNNDPFKHPTTASYGTDEYWAQGFPVVDIPQIHSYADLYSWITPPVTITKYQHYLGENYNKPAFIGEVGTVEWKTFEPDYMRVTAWPATCAGSAITPMMWTTPPFSLFGDSKMGPWLDVMSDEMKVLADFTRDIEFHKLGLTAADVFVTAPGEPAVTVIEDFEHGLGDWVKHGDGVTSIEQTTDHASEGSFCCRVNVNIPTWDEMPSPEPGIENFAMTNDWSAYWPHGTLKMDIFIPEFYHPEENPDGFLLGINKDPRSILEIHTDGPSGWHWGSTTNEYAEEGGWKKLTVGMLYNLELKMSTIPTAADAAKVRGIKFKFGNAGILKGPIYIDHITVGSYAFQTWGMISSNKQFAFAWIQDRQWTNRLASNTTFQINDLQPGAYQLEWWNTLTGPIASFNANAATGTLVVTVPDFTKDMAVKIRRIGSIGSTVHNVAVASISEYDWVVQSSTQEVRVMVLNQGTVDETFNVTLSNTTDGVGIGTNNVTVGSGSNITTTFIWDNTNVTPGISYEITGYAVPVVGETYTADNLLAGSIFVRTNEPPWDSCDRLRRWKEDSADTDGRALTVSTNHATEETHAFKFEFRAPDKEQAYFGYDQVYEDWSNKQAVNAHGR